MEKSELIQKIKHWLDMEQQIHHLSNQLRDLRKKKKELNLDLVDVMKTNEIDCFDCNTGKIMYTKTNVKKTINKKYLQDVLSKYYTDEDKEEADKICNYILENRDVQVKESIKLKKNKKE
tara:strand:- start:158 stop:517 length:360 start_codon:yes stop_codon:yes gene_type:complete